LADFGFSKKIEDIGGTILGTENFMSPEIYSGSEAYGFEVDMWAFGVLFFFMLNLEYPFGIGVAI
jgi:serine/threonine protein kinase